MEHVAGHAGDAWNELADYLAKTEAAQGHKLQRQQIDLRRWAPFLPFLWMAIHRDAGLPILTCSGFDITPPKLPLTKPHFDTAILPTRKTPAQFTLSLATLNVGSLFVGPEGYAGKLQYLREQMRSFKLNIICLQETRSPAGLSTVDDILKLARRAHCGQYGIEIWVNLAQPIGFANNKPQFLKKSQVQIVHADPRSLLARIAHPALQCLFLSMHAPQRGRPLGERRTWWKETHEIAHAHCKDIPLVVLIDANAKSGPQRASIVFERDDTCSANSEFFIEFTSSKFVSPKCESIAQRSNGNMDVSRWHAPSSH